MADRWSGISLFVISLIMAYLSWNLPWGSLRRPGPGLYPLLIALGISFLALLLFSKSWPAIPAKPKIGRMDQRRILYLLGSLLFYAVSFQGLGFLVSTFLFLLLLKPVVEKNWGFVLIGSVLVTLACFVIFGKVLKTTLPSGILGI